MHSIILLYGILGDKWQTKRRIEWIIKLTHTIYVILYNRYIYTYNSRLHETISSSQEIWFDMPAGRTVLVVDKFGKNLCQNQTCKNATYNIHITAIHNSEPNGHDKFGNIEKTIISFHRFGIGFVFVFAWAERYLVRLSLHSSVTNT